MVVDELLSRRVFVLSAAAAVPDAACVVSSLLPRRHRLLPDPRRCSWQPCALPIPRRSPSDRTGPDRADALDFARLDISIPSTHQIGNIEWPRGTNVDPAEHFALVGEEMLAGVDGLVRAVAGAQGGYGAETVLFVHGYNTNFAKGIYRHAQIAWDYELQGTQIHFAWPSAGDPFGYAFDRDSALIARDDLAALVERLLRELGVRLSIVGHSRARSS